MRVMQMLNFESTEGSTGKVKKKSGKKFIIEVKFCLPFPQRPLLNLPTNKMCGSILFK